MKSRIFVVDDDAATGLIVDALLGDEYDVVSFTTPASCLEQLQASNIPDVFLLDVQMPEMDGYELCRLIKQMPFGRNVPVLFISACDSAEGIMAGYDAGAEDYVLKPFDHIGLSKKIARLLQIEKDRQSILNQAADAEMLSAVFMDNMNEYAAVIKYLRALNECHNFNDVILETLKALEAYQLAGSVQIRMRDVEKTLGTSGENWPMELAVLQHVRTLGRIFEFKTRCVYNYGPVTILITNVPIENPERCGRIRDNLAIVAECAEAKLLAIESSQDKTRLRSEIEELMTGLNRFIVSYSKSYDEAKANGGICASQLLASLGREIGLLGITCQQEDHILELVSEHVEKMVDLFAFAGDSATELAVLRKRFDELLTITVDTTTEQSEAREPRANSSAVELF